MDRVIQKALRPFKQRMQKIVSRTVLNLVKDGDMQLLQVDGLDGETLDGVEHWQPYGMTYAPLAGGEALKLSVGGDRSHPVIVAVTDRRYRPKGLAAGEVCLYTNEDGGGRCRVHLKNGKEIHFCAGENSIVMTPDGITLTSNAFNMIKR